MRILAFLIALVGVIEAEEELIEVLLLRDDEPKEEDSLEMLLHLPLKSKIEIPSADFLLFYWRFPRVSDIHSEEFFSHFRRDSATGFSQFSHLIKRPKWTKLLEL